MHLFYFEMTLIILIFFRIIMADSGVPPDSRVSPDSGVPASGLDSGSHRGRSITRLTSLTAGRAVSQRMPVEFDTRTGKASGPNAPRFRSYLGVLARRHISITIPSWDDVQEVEKNLIWQDIQVFVHLNPNYNFK